ncbi:hypothetical protein OAN307_c09890 [Octadecabacter antarcticus 307]|uniref:Uncharacterized protein n=1 Tax=Octadecabacter antarcticus 307 TaxID=391626 RepID=M9R235_9RHOB|nr:hypothetical protein [Octadecabacter antarcticus]AGI66704.1 hypothetical protein OAN307_c09890 [Octadecabacter antarcticus 307]
MRFLVWIFLALAGIIGLPNMGRADDCRLRIRVLPQNLSTSVERTEFYLFIQDGRDVELLETQPRVFNGDRPRFDIALEHLDRGQGATIGLTFLVFDESGAQVQSNGMTEISVGSLRCNNAWYELRIRISARKANALMMRHLDGFESLNRMLNDGLYLPARISYLTEIIALDLDFDDREHDQFEALISRMFQSFEKLSDENKNWVLRELENIFLLSENSENALRVSLRAGYIDFLTSAMSLQNRTFLVRGKTPIHDYALGRLGRVMDVMPNGAVQSSAEVL